LPSPHTGDLHSWRASQRRMSVSSHRNLMMARISTNHRVVGFGIISSTIRSSVAHGRLGAVAAALCAPAPAASSDLQPSRRGRISSECLRDRSESPTLRTCRAPLGAGAPRSAAAGLRARRLGTIHGREEPIDQRAARHRVKRDHGVDVATVVCVESLELAQTTSTTSRTCSSKADSDAPIAARLPDRDFAARNGRPPRTMSRIESVPHV